MLTGEVNYLSKLGCGGGGGFKPRIYGDCVKRITLPLGASKDGFAKN